jgi:cell volume regulation protein A
MDSVAQTMVVISGLILVGAFGEFIFMRTLVQDVIWLVAAGILAGPVLSSSHRRSLPRQFRFLEQLP